MSERFETAALTEAELAGRMAIAGACLACGAHGTVRPMGRCRFMMFVLYRCAKCGAEVEVPLKLLAEMGMAVPTEALIHRG